MPTPFFAFTIVKEINLCLSYHTFTGYCSYLYARCFATTIWQQVCQEDPLSRSTGSAIRDKLLRYGGSKDPSTLLKDFAGDAIVRNCGSGIVPDICSLCREIGL
jgi:mitochondrial intermediate peptidase